MLILFLILLFWEHLTSWTAGQLWRCLCDCYLVYGQMRSGCWGLCSPRFLVFPKMNMHIFLRSQLKSWQPSWHFFFTFNLNASLSRLLLLVCVNLLSCVTGTVKKGLSILDSFPLGIKVRWPMNFVFWRPTSLTFQSSLSILFIRF